MKFHKRLLNNTGMGLLEVLIAVGITGGLALTIAKLMENSQQNAKQVEAKSETSHFKNTLANILTDTTACDYTFTPLITQANLAALSASPSASVAVPSIKDKNNNILYNTASTNLAPLTLTSIVMTNYNSSQGTADLMVRATYRKSSSQVVEVKPIKLPINFNIDNSVPASPNLLGCGTMVTAGGGGWQMAGNAGTDPSNDYVGTSDGQPMVFRTDAIERGRFNADGSLNLIHSFSAAQPLDANNARAMLRMSLTPFDDPNNRVGYGVLLETYTNNTYGDTTVALSTSSKSTYSGRNVTIGSSVNYLVNWAAATTSFGVAGSVIHGTGDAGSQQSYGLHGTASATTPITNFTGPFRHGIMRGVHAQVSGTMSVNPLIISEAGPPAYTHPSVSALTAVDLTDGAFGGGTGNTYAGYFYGKVKVTKGIEQDAWTPLTLQAGWANCSWPGVSTPSYFKDSMGIVHLKGCIQRTGAAFATGLAPTVFLLPAGYRPDAHGQVISGMLAKDYSGGTCYLYFSAPGTFGIANGSGASFNTNEKCMINGVTFRADN